MIKRAGQRNICEAARKDSGGSVSCNVIKINEQRKFQSSTVCIFKMLSSYTQYDVGATSGHGNTLVTDILA